MFTTLPLSEVLIEVNKINSGKKFENTIKSSIPDYVLYHRLNDSTGTFSGGSNLRFSSKQPCDAFLFDGRRKILYCLELKTSKSGSFSYESIECKEKQPSKMIHKHQILSLERLGMYERIMSGFLFNFRLENETLEHTYFQSIKNFLIMYKSLNKKSFNEKDLLNYNPINIEGKKKIKNWSWNIEKFLQEVYMTCKV